MNCEICGALLLDEEEETSGICCSCLGLVEERSEVFEDDFDDFEDEVPENGRLYDPDNDDYCGEYGGES